MTTSALPPTAAPVEPAERMPTAHEAQTAELKASIDETWRQAMQLATSALDLAEQAGRPLDMATALCALARCQRGLGAAVQAETTFRKSVAWARCTGSTDLEADVLCELAHTALEVARSLVQNDEAAARSARDRARDAAFDASKRAPHVADVHWEAQILLRAAEVLTGCGEHEDAALLKHRAQEVLGSSSPARH